MRIRRRREVQQPVQREQHRTPHRRPVPHPPHHQPPHPGHHPPAPAPRTRPRHTPSAPATPATRTSLSPSSPAPAAPPSAPPPASPPPPPSPAHPAPEPGTHPAPPAPPPLPVAPDPAPPPPRTPPAPPAAPRPPPAAPPPAAATAPSPYSSTEASLPLVPDSHFRTIRNGSLTRTTPRRSHTTPKLHPKEPHRCPIDAVAIPGRRPAPMRVKSGDLDGGHREPRAEGAGNRARQERRCGLGVTIVKVTASPAVMLGAADHRAGRRRIGRQGPPGGGPEDHLARSDLGRAVSFGRPTWPVTAVAVFAGA